MDISLPSDLENFIEESIRKGTFVDASEVVSEALLRMREQEAAMPTDPQELSRFRSAIQAGIDQAERGECTPWNAEEVRNEGLKRLRGRP